MKTIFYTLALITGFSVAVHAQQFKLAKTSGTLEIHDLNHVTIEGYDGAEILFTSRQDRDEDTDKRSKGLRAISNSGIEDNTGVGLSVVDNGTVYVVRQLKKMDGPEIKIMVPKGVSISLENSTPYGDDVHISNVEGSVDVSLVHNGVYLDNVTGAVDIKTVHGEVEAIFGLNMKNSIRIESAHGPVDVTLPVTIKATIRARTSHGEILVDPDFKLDIDKSAGMIRYNDGITGKINGGGIDVRIGSTHNNVYLRKK